jgi:hypothetical protein
VLRRNEELIEARECHCRWQMRTYWFELFECMRKVLLVALPICLDPSSSAQLPCGLIICFVTFGMYA